MTRLRDWSAPRLLVIGFGLVTVVTLLVAASTSSVAFGLYNSAWDGASDLRSLADTTGATSEIAQNTTAYTDAPPNKTVALVLAPEQAYTPQDRARLKDFVRAGGTLIVAADYATHANPLLAAVGADARIDGRPLRDERYMYRSPAMPVARNVNQTHPLGAGLPSVTLNHGTAVNPHTATVVVQTSPYAYVDTNQNANLDATESVGTYPVVTSEALGHGRVIVVGDPSLFINTMLDRPGNRAFVTRLVSQHTHVLLDYSHTAELPPLAIVLLTLRDSALVQFLSGILATLLIGLASNTTVRQTIQKRLSPAALHNRRSLSVPDEELVAYLQERYPDWDTDRIHRIVSTQQERETQQRHE